MICTIFFWVLLGVASGFICPEPGICECAENVISCICDDRQNITLNVLFHLSVDTVLVHRCGTVILPLGTMLQMNLNIIELQDIQHLQVRPFSLSGADSISKLRITDVANFEVKSLGFSGLSNLTSIYIRNVTTHILNKAAFGQIAEVKEFVIENSVFHDIDSLAFLLSNITKFRVIDTRIGTMRNTSLLIHNAEEVAFVNSSVDITGESSFILAFVGEFKLINCTFGKIVDEAILSKQLNDFTVKHCVIKEIESDALKDMNVLHRVTMYDNVFGIIAKNSLFPNLTETLEIDTMGNLFPCNCESSWLWAERRQEIYKDLLRTSSCISDKNKRLSTLLPQLDADGTCYGIKEQPKEKDNYDHFYGDYYSDEYELSKSNYFKDNIFSVYILTFLSLYFSRILCAFSER